MRVVLAPARRVDCRQGASQAGIVGDLAFLHRNIEIDADQGALCG